MVETQNNLIENQQDIKVDDAKKIDLTETLSELKDLTNTTESNEMEKHRWDRIRLTSGDGVILTVDMNTNSVKGKVLPPGVNLLKKLGYDTRFNITYSEKTKTIIIEGGGVRKFLSQSKDSYGNLQINLDVPAIKREYMKHKFELVRDYSNKFDFDKFFFDIDENKFEFLNNTTVFHDLLNLKSTFRDGYKLTGSDCYRLYKAIVNGDVDSSGNVIGTGGHVINDKGNVFEVEGKGKNKVYGRVKDFVKSL